jgi:MbtH protein
VNTLGDTSERFRILVNEQKQYALWPDGRDIPAGWRTVCDGLSRQETLHHIDSVSTDSRPSEARTGDTVDG